MITVIPSVFKEWVKYWELSGMGASPSMRQWMCMEHLEGSVFGMGITV